MALALDLTDDANGPFHYLDVLKTGEKDVKLPKGKEIAIKHTGRQDDGTASVAGDHLVIMHQKDTMAANRNAGRKVVLEVGESFTFKGGDIEPSSVKADGSHVIQLRAVTNGCKVQFLVGQLTRKS